MATIAYHTLTSTQTVVLPRRDRRQGRHGLRPAPTTSRSTAATGRSFDRTNPIEAAARGQAWTGTAHALIGELGVGTATASTLQVALALAGLFAALGATLFLTGAGLVWAVRPVRETAQGPGAPSGHDGRVAELPSWVASSEAAPFWRAARLAPSSRVSAEPWGMRWPAAV